MRRLEGKVAVVLGACGVGNIGQAIARRFAAEGARLVVGGRDAGPLEAFAAELGAGARVCDITDEAGLDALFEEAGGAVDIAVNSAGRNMFCPFMDTTAADMEALCRVHVIGPLLFTQAAVRAMPSGGSVIHVSSVTAQRMMAHHVAYIATKAAGEMVMKAAALELGARGIRVNAIAPGLTRTPMTEDLFADAAMIDGISQHVPLRRVGTVEDTAAAAAWLACDECFMTGETVQANGGMAINSLGN